MHPIRISLLSGHQVIAADPAVPVTSVSHARSGLIQGHTAAGFLTVGWTGKTLCICRSRTGLDPLDRCVQIRHQLVAAYYHNDPAGAVADSSYPIAVAIHIV